MQDDSTGDISGSTANLNQDSQIIEQVSLDTKADSDGDLSKSQHALDSTTDTLQNTTIPLQETEPQAQSPEPEEDDDFGEFAEPEVIETPIKTELPKSLSLPESIADLENVISQFLASQNLEDSDALKMAFPIQHELDKSNANAQEAQGLLIEEQGKRGKHTSPNPCVHSTRWYEFYKHITSDTVFSEKGTRFLWRRSLLRKLFLKSINVEPIEGSKSKSDLPAVKTNVNVEEKQQPISVGSAAVGSISALDDREKDFLEAKKLSEITEDDLRKKTPQELEVILDSLHKYHQKMHEQANYWLDSKEQLMMDAETHNKVIASLIQYAHQQQDSPKANPKESKNKKKKNLK